jgi:mycothiol system anti-sigma-R factor
VSAAHARGSHGCREIFARLSEYLDGELDPEVCAGLEEHMDDCPPCQAFLESLRRTVDLTRHLPGQELPEELRQELVEAYRKIRDTGGG